MNALSVREEMQRELARMSDEQVAALLRMVRALRPLSIPTPEQVAQSEFYNTDWPVYDGDELPADYSVNLEHYLYGVPKQEP